MGILYLVVLVACNFSCDCWNCGHEVGCVHGGGGGDEAEVVVVSGDVA